MPTGNIDTNFGAAWPTLRVGRTSRAARFGLPRELQVAQISNLFFPGGPRP
jgi:hypothetical protein